jgi:hypothetical protein
MMEFIQPILPFLDSLIYRARAQVIPKEHPQTFIDRISQAMIDMISQTLINRSTEALINPRVWISENPRIWISENREAQGSPNRMADSSREILVLDEGRAYQRRVTGCCYQIPFLAIVPMDAK